MSVADIGIGIGPIIVGIIILTLVVFLFQASTRHAKKKGLGREGTEEAAAQFLKEGVRDILQ